MTLLNTCSLAIVMACMSCAASAQETPVLSKQFSGCMERSGGVTAGMIACIETETQRHDVRLNNAYKAVMDELTPERKKQLQEVQRTWLKFRDTNCGFYADPDGGTLARVSASKCVMSTTAIRARELEDLR